MAGPQKIQKNYTIPYILYLSLGNLVYQDGKLKDREGVLKELVKIDINYKKDKVDIKGLDTLIADLENKDIGVIVKADPIAKECIEEQEC